MAPVQGSNVLSTQAQWALRAERQEAKALSAQSKPVFWDKWSRLSTGQKWGRALAWVVPPLGIGLHAAAQMWQNRAAKTAAARPADTVIKKSDAHVNGIATRSMTTFGARDRQGVKSLIEENLRAAEAPVSEGSPAASSAAMLGLPTVFAKDLLREQDHHLQGADGHNTTALTGQSTDPAADFRSFFHQEFSGDRAKADAWAGLAARFMSQDVPLALNVQNAFAMGIRLTSAEHAHAFRLKMEPGGSSALLEVRSTGAINNIIDAATSKPILLPGRDFEPDTSSMQEVSVLRLRLGPPEDFDVIACQTSHRFQIAEPGDSDA
jgi:hypothetical protein